jgi:hypothetical protein
MQDNIARLRSIGYSTAGAVLCIRDGLFDEVWTAAHEAAYTKAANDDDSANVLSSELQNGSDQSGQHVEPGSTGDTDAGDGAV